MSITCPHCSRVGRLKAAVPNGTKVRCPGCFNKFEVGPNADAPIDLGNKLDDDPFAPDAGTWGGGAQPADDCGIDLGHPEISPSDLHPAASMTPSAPAQTPFAASTSPPPIASPARQLPPEPWFYGWLDWVAGALWTFAVVILTLDLIGAFLAFLAAFAAPGQNFNTAMVAVLAYMVFVVPLSLVPVVTSSALIRLAVDAARHLRILAFKAIVTE